jgi:hypothetical protein
MLRKHNQGFKGDFDQLQMIPNPSACSHLLITELSVCLANSDAGIGEWIADLS